MSSKNLFENLTPKAEEAPVEKVTEVKEEVKQEAEPPVVKEPEDEKPDEFAFLKSRAALMNVSYSADIDIDGLRALVHAKLNNEPALEPKATTQASQEVVKDVEVVPTKKQKLKTLRQHIHDENMRLVRIRLTNMDEKDKDLNGQYYTVANEFLGTVTRFIPFAEAAERGWHVPYCLLKFLRSQKFLQIRVINPNRSDERVETKYVRKFAIEELPPLTDVEMAKLADTQRATRATEDD